MWSSQERCWWIAIICELLHFVCASVSFLLRGNFVFPTPPYADVTVIVLCTVPRPQPAPLFLNIHASRRRPDVSRAPQPVNNIYPCSWRLGPLPVEISGVCALYLTVVRCRSLISDLDGGCSSSSDFPDGCVVVEFKRYDPCPRADPLYTPSILMVIHAPFIRWFYKDCCPSNQACHDF